MKCRRLAGLLAVALQAGCSWPHANAPLVGQTLVVGVANEPPSLDPALLDGTIAAEVGTLLFSFLTTVGPHGELEPDVATVVPTAANGGISPDGKRVIFHLRRGVRFSDGTPLTARDCIFTYRAILNPNTAIPNRILYDDVRSIRAPDDYTLVLTFAHGSRINAEFLSINYNYAILPEHVLARYHSLDRVDFNQHPIGSGPYRLVEWMRGDHLLLAANNQYFRGAPKIARLRIEFVPDQQTMLDELRAHEVDAAFELDADSYTRLRAIPALRTVLTPSVAFGVLVLGAGGGPTAERAVREAIASAIDVPALTERTAFGVYLAGNARRTLLGLPRGPAQTPSFDPARARALLTGAGWLLGRDGVRRRDGVPLELTLISKTTPEAARVDLLVQAELRAIGVAVNIHTYTNAALFAPPGQGGPAFGGHFSILFMSIYVGADDDLSWLYQCDRIPPDGFDISRICDPRLDALGRAEKAAVDPVAVEALNARYERELEEDVPEIPLYQPQEIDAVTVRLHHFSPTPGSPFANVWRWSL